MIILCDTYSRYAVHYRPNEFISFLISVILSTLFFIKFNAIFHTCISKDYIAFNTNKHKCHTRFRIQLSKIYL